MNIENILVYYGLLLGALRALREEMKNCGSETSSHIWSRLYSLEEKTQRAIGSAGDFAANAKRDKKDIDEHHDVSEEEVRKELQSVREKADAILSLIEDLRELYRDEKVDAIRLPMKYAKQRGDDLLKGAQQ